MTLTILSVAYPLAPVSVDAAGGAEQVLAMLDRAIAGRGHRSIVIACEGSCVSGVLLPVPRVAGPLSETEIRAARTRHRAAIAAALARWRIDLVHMHGADWHDYVPASGVPVLATLHLPVAWYQRDALAPARSDTFVNCVSASQHMSCPHTHALLHPIANGIDLDAFYPARVRRRGFALVLGRICPEKGLHLAIEAAERAGIPLLIAGTVFPYPEHRRYFEDRIAPALGKDCRYIGAVGQRAKRKLLSMARCVLVPSLAAETSSLVAREAAACGTPVIAFGKGALPETVVHGRTGFLVGNVEEMAAATRRAGEIAPAACRAHAQAHFSAGAMTDAYLKLYARLAGARERLSGAA